MRRRSRLSVEQAVKIQRLEHELDLTAKQSEAVDMYIKTDGKVNESAREMGYDNKTAFQRHIDGVLLKCKKKGFYPALGLNSVVPDGQTLKAKSIMWRNNPETGIAEPVLWWDKNDNSSDISDAFLKAFSEQVEPPIIPAGPLFTDDQLVTEYIITDYHLGMLAWRGEGGDDWDIKIAEEMIVKWFAAAIAKSEPSKHAVFAQLGDFLHYDGLVPVTPASKHVLDADSRFALVVETALRIVRKIIDMLLTKHKHVTVILAEGNHDEASSVWLRKCFNMFYKGSDRVTVDDSNIPYYAVQFGSVALYYHHGHKKAMKALDVALTAMFPKIFGDTVYRYASCGHYHHQKKEESSLMIVEQYPTLAARDAYAARGGYLSHRSASVHTYHVDYGRISTNTITPDMIKAA